MLLSNMWSMTSIAHCCVVIDWHQLHQRTFKNHKLYFSSYKFDNPYLLGHRLQWNKQEFARNFLSAHVFFAWDCTLKGLCDCTGGIQGVVLVQEFFEARLRPA
jgi:hypothetical protein